MKCDIVVTADDRASLVKTLVSVVRRAKKSSVGKIVVGWTGEDQYEPADLDLFGFYVVFESLPRGSVQELAGKWCKADAVLFMEAGTELRRGALREIFEKAGKPR